MQKTLLFPVAAEITFVFNFVIPDPLIPVPSSHALCFPPLIVIPPPSQFSLPSMTSMWFPCIESDIALQVDSDTDIDTDIYTNTDIDIDTNTDIRTDIDTNTDINIVLNCDKSFTCDLTTCVFPLHMTFVVVWASNTKNQCIKHNPLYLSVNRPENYH